jgi:ACS family hexuronate transporter-like MFS transporter
MTSKESPMSRYRWTVCALVFFATTVNYLDRNVLGLLKPMLEQGGVFGPDAASRELNYSNVVICFQFAYAIGMLLAGRWIDRVGAKRGYAAALLGWCVAAIGHAFGHHTWSFGFWRAALGVAEAGNFPAANRIVAEWFPLRERALATGLYNSGANVGAIVAPLFVPAVAMAWGWEWAFVITGAVGLVWLLFWWRMYDSPEKLRDAGRINAAEYAHIQSDRAEMTAPAPEASWSWGRVLGLRPTWAFIVGKLLTDPVWWFYLFWLPAFLNGENARKTAAFLAEHPGADALLAPGLINWPVALAVVYTVATFGSIFGGWLPKALIGRGMAAPRARSRAMLAIALLPLAVLAAGRLGEINTWYAVLVISLACAAHQAWSANLFTTVSDLFPKSAVASVTGIGGMAGALGGILYARLAGELLAHFAAQGHTEQGYFLLFMFSGCAYLLAWVLMRALVPPPR